ncbi:YcaO-like family protein [Frankia sp. CiP3]|uniref:YcaO-like family protein n=1 Tax=Frankia sp. CiP3 TaxID=2880971 RepID=UPI001EF43665|nr:YcaO-like family protein [Frankia sp. CiP3]
MSTLQPAGVDLLVDARCGIVRKLLRVPTPDWLPAQLVVYGADVAGLGCHGPWVDPWTSAATLADPPGARAAALGEAAERYAGNLVPPGLRRGSAGELRDGGAQLVGPADLPLYAPWQYAARGFPFVPFTDDLRIAWVDGVDLTSGATVAVPASLAYLNYHHNINYRRGGPDHADRPDRRRAAEPVTHGVYFPGIAAGPSPVIAQETALAEVIERDAVSVWWCADAPATGIDLDSLPELAAVLATTRLRCHLAWIPTRLGLPVVAALLHDPEQGIVTLGSAARQDPTAAAVKAFAEACQLALFSADLLDPASRVWKAVATGRQDRRCFLPYRADRRYLDQAGVDYRAAVDFAVHAQLYLDPRMHDRVDRLRRPARVLGIDDISAGSHSHVLQRLTDQDLRAVAIDLTSSDLRTAGVHVARVVVPGLCANAPAALPYLGAHRLYTEPVALGWAAAPLRPTDVVRAPIPAI